MKRLIGIAFLTTATILRGQSTDLPDCRAPSTVPIGSPCVYTGTSLPKQTYIGDITLPSSEHVRMTEPFQLMSPPPVNLRVSKLPTLGALFTVQTETLGYKAYVSSGFKLFAMRQWSDWRGVDVRGTVVEFSLDGIGREKGQDNHTLAIAAGPRVQHSYGRVTPYAEILVGALHQYFYGMSESGVLGASVRLNNHISFVPVDIEYRYASFQSSTRYYNPRRGRIELSTGLTYNF